MTTKTTTIQTPTPKAETIYSRFTIDLTAVLAACNSAKSLNLVHSELFDAITLQAIESRYCKPGIDTWTNVSRQILMWLLHDIIEALILYDMEGFVGGSHTSFTQANKALATNIEIIARKKYGWWHPRRYFLLKLAPKLQQLADEYGWESWNSNNKTTDIDSNN